ncbi:MAG: NUDIX hydrolase [Acidobacteriota bacterium]
MNIVYEGKHVVVLERDGWEFVERKKAKSAVVIVARTDDGKIILTEQFRRPVDARVIDFAAGLVGDEGNHDEEETARRELEEETGYRCESMQRVASGPTSPGITSEIVTFFLATGLDRRGAGGGVGSEKIVVHEVPQGGVVEWLHEREREGVLIDNKIWAGFYLLSKST